MDLHLNDISQMSIYFDQIKYIIKMFKNMPECCILSLNNLEKIK